MQTSARTFMQQSDAAQSVSNSSPAPGMPFALAVDGKKLMSFQLRGGWVQEVASAAAAVFTDAELQTNVKTIGRAHAVQAAQFDSFYPRFVEALDAASRGHWASQARGKRHNSSQTAISDSFQHSLGVSWAAYSPARPWQRRLSERRHQVLWRPRRGQWRSNQQQLPANRARFPHFTTRLLTARYRDQAVRYRLRNLLH